MCGIAGIFDHHLRPEVANFALAEMNKSLIHRGPDHGETWQDEKNGVYLGHRRLSILDLSPLGNQPMVSSSKRFVITFNGEIYNFKTLKAELGSAAHSLVGSSDTEVLLRCIEVWGLKTTLEKSVGMFAFGLFDRDAEKLTLVRDRMGEKPLYYHKNASGIYFASELRALIHSGLVDFNLDPDALQLYLRFGNVPWPYSVLKNTFKLAPGELIEFSRSGREYSEVKTRYWDSSEVWKQQIESRTEETEDQVLRKLDDLIQQSVEGQMISDVPLGAFLSGGIDSSLVVATMQSQSDLPVKTFSIGFHENAYDEAPHARQISKFLKTDHTEVYLTGEEAAESALEMSQIYDEPFSDSSQIPTYLVSKIAKKEVTVCLSGDGGDELFCGYDRYFIGEKIWSTFQRSPAWTLDLFQNIVRISPNEAWVVIERALRKWKKFRHLSRKIHTTTLLSKEKSFSHFYQAFMSMNLEPLEFLKGSVRLNDKNFEIAELKDIESLKNRMMTTDLIHYLPNDILTKVDRAAMAVSLETRIPLLAPEIVRYAGAVPQSLKIKSNCQKYLLKELLYQKIPKKLLDRPKMGFGIPIQDWLRTSLRSWAEQKLKSDSLLELGLNQNLILNLWEQHLGRKSDFAYQLWNVLMLIDWYERWSSIASLSKKSLESKQAA